MKQGQDLWYEVYNPAYLTLGFKINPGDNCMYHFKTDVVVCASILCVCVSRFMCPPSVLPLSRPSVVVVLRRPDQRRVLDSHPSNNKASRRGSCC